MEQIGMRGEMGAHTDRQKMRPLRLGSRGGTGQVRAMWLDWYIGARNYADPL